MKGFLKILAFIFIGLALHTWGSYNLRTGETYFLLLNIKTNIGETGNWQAVFIQGILGLILWVMSKERPNNEIIAEGRIRNGMEYFKEFLEASTSDIKTTSNAAKITVPYLELTDKINPDICAQQILDETSLPVGRETLKNALKWCLESKDIHSAFNMSKQEYKQLVLTHYLLLSRFLQGVGQVPLGSREYFSKCEGKKEAELQALKQVENKFQTLAKRERYQLFAEIEYYFPFPAGEEIASFGMELINRAAKLGRYYLPENSVEAAEHILRMIGLDLYRQFFSMLEEDTALMSDEKIRFHLSLLSSKLFHDKQFESKTVELMEKVNNEEGVYSARGTSFVAAISLCSHYIASKLNSSEDKIDSNEMSCKVSSLFFPFLKDEDRDKLIAFGLERAQSIYSSDPHNKWMVKASELTEEFCLSSSCEEDDRCIQAAYEIFNGLLKDYQAKEESSPGDEYKYDGEV